MNDDWQTLRRKTAAEKQEITESTERDEGQGKGRLDSRNRGSTRGRTVLSGQVLTRMELAEALKVSLRTVDMILADGDITPVRLRGKLVRFYLPCCRS